MARWWHARGMTQPAEDVEETARHAGPVAHVAELWRYPVKSMGGERVPSLEVLRDGIAHDRRYAFVSSGAPAGKPRLTGRERAALLQYKAAVAADGPEVETPEDERFPVADPRLIAYLEERMPQGNRFRLEHEADAAPYTDVRPIAIASREALRQLEQEYGGRVDARRFRVNLLLRFSAEAVAALSGADATAFPEDALPGQVLQLGADCRLRVLERIPRCRVVTLDPETSEPEPALMKHLDRRHGGRLGVYAAVVAPGRVYVDDPVSLAQAGAAGAYAGGEHRPAMGAVLPPLPGVRRPNT